MINKMNFPGYAAYLVDGFGNYSEDVHRTPMGIVILIQQYYLDDNAFTDEDLYVVTYYNNVQTNTHHFPVGSYFGDIMSVLLPN